MSTETITITRKAAQELYDVFPPRTAVGAPLRAVLAEIKPQLYPKHQFKALDVIRNKKTGELCIYDGDPTDCLPWQRFGPGGRAPSKTINDYDEWEFLFNLDSELAGGQVPVFLTLEAAEGDLYHPHWGQVCQAYSVAMARMGERL